MFMDKKIQSMGWLSMPIINSILKMLNMKDFNENFITEKNPSKKTLSNIRIFKK